MNAIHIPWRRPISSNLMIIRTGKYGNNNNNNKIILRCCYCWSSSHPIHRFRSSCSYASSSSSSVIVKFYGRNNNCCYSTTGWFLMMCHNNNNNNQTQEIHFLFKQQQQQQQPNNKFSFGYTSTTKHYFSTSSSSSSKEEDEEENLNCNRKENENLTNLLKDVLRRDNNTTNEQIYNTTSNNTVQDDDNTTKETTTTTKKEIISSDDTNNDNKYYDDPKTTWILDEYVESHIRACLSKVHFENEELGIRDTGLSIITLGTGAGWSSNVRNTSSTVIKHGSINYLIDAGEGVTRQFIQSKLNYREIRKIFITHMHGDHVLGLPGLLLSLQVANINAKEKRDVEIYGPVGLYNFLCTTLTLTHSEIRKLNVYVYELHGGTQRSMKYASNRNNYNDFRHRGIYRKIIKQNIDGTWTLTQPIEITTPDLALQYSSTPKGLLIKAGEIHHVPQLQCFGYTFQEPITQPRPINVEKAKQLGVTNSKKYALLKSGFTVQTDNDDSETIIHPDQVCGIANKARKITVLGDCCLIPPIMEQLCINSDVLIHEATLRNADTGSKVLIGGHSSSSQAAQFANIVQPTILLLNHLSKRADKRIGMEEILYEALQQIRCPTRIQLCYDYMQLLIPRNGFNFTIAMDNEKPLLSSSDDSENSNDEERLSETSSSSDEDSDEDDNRDHKKDSTVQN